ncbi:MAG: DUF2189 domain-containing protein [Alphaproteobacteria bacterium]
MARDPAAGEPRRIPMEAPWSWLAAGWQDLWRVPHIGLTYGALFTIIGLALTLGLMWLEMLYAAVPLAAGFMLLGPLLAVGLYDTSRRLDKGQPVSLASALSLSLRAPGRLAMAGLFLALALLAWLYLATVLFALFYGHAAPALDQAFTTLLFTVRGLVFLALGTAVGGVLAAFVFAISAFSIPLLLERDREPVDAMLESLRRVRENPKPMLLWAWLIVMVTACGLVTLGIGLIITFPLVGHATWHAYRDTYGRSAD